MVGADATKPCRYRIWIFPRDSTLADKAGRVLDLHTGTWHGVALAPTEFVISADEKTSFQAR